MHTLRPTRVRFGAFELDLTTGELRSQPTPDSNDKVLLREQVFQVLRMLLERKGQIVTREDIKAKLWPDHTIVDFDQSINATINALRRALGDSAEIPRYVETLARRGYRWIPPIEYAELAPMVPVAGEAVTEHSHSSVPAEKKVAQSRVFDVIGGTKRHMILALAAIAILAVGVWRYNVYLHRITLTPTDTIVLADIDNRTSDRVFDDALNGALRYELEQTPYLNLLELDKTYNTLAQLGLSPNTKVTAAIARQICSKTSSRMVISSSIADAGNRYRLEIRALDCESGATLAEEHADVSARGQVVHELGQAGARLRSKIGEPAQSVARFNQPLEKATSASLEALQTGAEGTKLFFAGDPQAALPLYQRGIELDPNLALTYEGIGAANAALGHFDLQDFAYTRAYGLRDRMTEKDRLNSEYLYYSDVTGELDRSHSVLVEALELFPRNIFFHNNLAITLARLGQPDRAAEAEDETARLDPSALYFSWAAAANINASRFNQAKSWLVQARASKFVSFELSVQEYRLAFIEGDQGTLGKIFEDESHGPNRAAFLRERSKVEASQGRVEFANHLLQEASRLSSDPEQISQDLVFSALQDAEVGRVIQARNAQEQAFKSKLDRNRKMILALALARSGRTEEAWRLADEVSQEAPLDTLVQNYLVPTVRAAIQLHKHNPTAAIDLLRGTLAYDLAYTESPYFLYPAYIRGLAYLELGDGRSASAEFQKLIDNPGMCWGLTGPLARFQIARTERLMGDNASARKFYEEFFTMWKNADPSLPIYRQAKSEYGQLQNHR